MKDLKTLKNCIKWKLPNCINHKLYVYDTVGCILFGTLDKWEPPFKMFDTSSKKEYIVFTGILELISDYNKEEQEDILNFIFVEVFGSLLCDSNVKYL